MNRWRRSTIVTLLAAGVVTGCGGSDSTAPATTQVPIRLFAIDRAELDRTGAAITDVTRKLADSISDLDADAATPLAATRFRAVDPVYPSLGFSRIDVYYDYLSSILDTTETVREIVVNADGSLTRVDWPTFFHTDPAGFDGPLAAARHLLIDGGKVTRLMHLFERDQAARSAAAISAVIPFATVGIPLDRSVADINAQADAAADLATRWAAAWTAHDPAAVRLLYNDAAVHHDEFAGPPKSPAQVAIWAEQLFASFPDLTVTVDGSFSSGVGPAVFANFTGTHNGSSCTVRVGVVWSVDNDHHIEREDMYYDPTTLVACGWVS